VRSSRICASPRAFTSSAGVATDLDEEFDQGVQFSGTDWRRRGDPTWARPARQPPDDALEHGGGFGMAVGESASDDVGKQTVGSHLAELLNDAEGTVSVVF